ncbi:MAG: DUF1800 domain-containing protein [Burkholderiaceae bacterium]|nr:DUF1800 domain-containing protein [Roseateles sp.]MBV8471277.1 DUF1800 domain-containing protein [Burkholderiaceae bacterium]
MLNRRQCLAYFPLGLAPGILAGLGGCAGSPARQTAAAAAPDAAPAVASAFSAMADELWLDRLSWGSTSSELAELRRMGRAAWLQRQLSASRPGGWADLPTEARAQIDAMSIGSTSMPELVRTLEAQRKSAEALQDDAQKQAAQKAYQVEMNRLAREASSRMLLGALYAPAQLREQMGWFWFNHFNVYQHKHNLRAMLGDYNEQLRAHALGRFRELLQLTVFHPAMLRYLDNEQNGAGHINENYARELLELHTLGVDGGYSQRDVQELARVLTGLGVRLNDDTPRMRPALQALYVRRGLAEFNPQRHDFGDKTVLGLTIQGRGIAEIEQVLDHLARQPATARFLSRKLAQYFVADDPPPPLVERMAASYLRSDGQIGVVLRTMIEAPEFDASLGRKFKDPLHYVVSAVRMAYDGRVILNTGPMQNWLNRLGQTPFDHQTPDGYPLQASSWNSAGQMNTRFELARAIGGGSAGLFRVEGKPVDKPAFPQLATSLYYEGVAPHLSASSREALAQAASPQEWNSLLLSSPEFMMR